jgi:hypothetical protein
VTDADPVWESRRHNSDVATQATAGESVHSYSLVVEPRDGGFARGVVIRDVRAERRG